MSTPREINKAGLFYRLSTKNKKATAISEEEVPANLPTTAEGDDAPPLASVGSNDLSVAQSWRVSDEEFIVKIDASPVHMSAAQRMFGGKIPSKPAKAADDEFQIKIDASPLHMSHAQRMFGGTKLGDKATKEETIKEEEEAHEEWGDFWKNMFHAFDKK